MKLNAQTYSEDVSKFKDRLSFFIENRLQDSSHSHYAISGNFERCHHIFQHGDIIEFVSFYLNIIFNVSIKI